MELRYYITEDGRSPMAEWRNSLRDKTTQVKIDVRIARLRLGNLSGSKTVGDGVHELILDFGPGYRIYFAPRGKEIVVLLCGGTKKRQQRDIDLAKLYWANYKRADESNGKVEK